jgi:DNA-binding HxlR family transcriptional regulator
LIRYSTRTLLLANEKHQKRHPEDSVGAAISLLADHWTFLILREAFFGTRRFNEFAERLGLSRNILSDRLKQLVATGIFEMHPYGPGKTRHEYLLGQPGRDVFPIVVALLQWGDKYLNPAAAPSIVLEHVNCGADADPRMVCSSCGETIDVLDILPRPGPGATELVRERLAGLSDVLEADLEAEHGDGAANQPSSSLARDKR